jgi:hypothetical protein
MASAQTPGIAFSPSSLNFASQLVGASSAAQVVTLTNTGTATLSISKISITGANVKDYSQTNNCGSSVAAGANCAINVTFTPAKKGTRTANVSVTDNAAGSPQTVSLTGTGIAPTVTLTPSKVVFNSQLVGTTSAQTVNLKNTGNAALTVSGISASGDFAQTNTCGSSVAIGYSCTITVTFTPTTSGTRTGSVTATDNASGSPQTVSLTGTGVSGTASGALTVLGPAPRFQHSAVFDSATNTMIVFGGQNAGLNNFNDVWQSVIFEDTNANDFDWIDWLPVNPLGTPPAARYGHTGVYDSTNSLMMVFGGGLGVGSPAPCQNDMWILQDANGIAGPPNWIPLTTSGSAPSPRFAHTAVYDPNTDSMIVFGGYDCTSNYFNDVWVLNNANGLGGTPTWSQLSPSGTAPPGREAATAVYDPTTNVMIVFGGDTGVSALLGDVWILSNANGTGGTPSWAQLFPTGTAPASRTGHSAVLDSVNNRMIVYGGLLSGGTVAADSWILIGANGQAGVPQWSLIPVGSTGISKAYHSAIYNPATNEMLVFAGTLSGVPSDDHTFVLGDANGLP